jgi:uncharacterized protein YecE (DUF72 family)
MVTGDLSALERKAKRELRRAKQRLANVGRARKMHAARLANAESQAQTGAVKKTHSKRPQYFVGCSGWFYWHWRGAFYPAELPTKGWFNHYSAQFQTVELNAPFYAWPTLATVQSWLKQIGGKNFVYTVKVCELITHVKRFRGTKLLVRDFGYIADLLGEWFGCFLFQLPPSFKYTPARLKLIIDQLDHTRRNVLEFRHASWWNEKVYAAFARTGTIFCSSSGPKLPDTFVKTADDVYIRFHGVKQWYRHDYSNAELGAWAEKIKASGAKRIWAYFNNDRNGHAIKNAKQLLKILKST